MAKILFSVPPLTGHLNPALAVAAVLERRGHSIAWAVHCEQIGAKLPDNALMYDLETQAGSDLARCSPDVRGLESVRLFFEDYALPLARTTLIPIEAAVRAFHPDIMVADHQMPAAALVARKFDVPWVTLVTTSASILKMSAMLDAWVAEQYLDLQKEYLPEAKTTARPDFSPFDNIVFSIEALLGDTHDRVVAPYTFVGPALGPGRKKQAFPWEWLATDRKKILVTLGTVSRDRDTRFFEVIMEAVAGMNIQAVLVAPARLAKQAPANVLVQPYVPQLDLLKHMSGVICHAGHNTVCEALAQGLPLVVAPIRDDQPVVARQAINAGVAVFMRYGKVTAATARTTLEHFLNDSTLAANAVRIAVALRTAAGAEGAADRIIALAAAHTRPLEMAG